MYQVLCLSFGKEWNTDTDSLLPNLTICCRRQTRNQLLLKGEHRKKSLFQMWRVWKEEEEESARQRRKRPSGEGTSPGVGENLVFGDLEELWKPGTSVGQSEPAGQAGRVVLSPTSFDTAPLLASPVGVQDLLSIFWGSWTDEGPRDTFSWTTNCTQQ